MDAAKVVSVYAGRRRRRLPAERNRDEERKQKGKHPRMEAAHGWQSHGGNVTGALIKQLPNRLSCGHFFERVRRSPGRSHFVSTGLSYYGPVKDFADLASHAKAQAGMAREVRSRRGGTDIDE